MPDEHFEELGRKLSEAADQGDEQARDVLDRLNKYRDDPDDDSLDWLNEAAIRWESEHPELANIAVRVINALTAGGF
jgi:predicted NBD/HSP70 family sugar kinase